VPPGLLLESYPGALEQILFNLFENAMVHGFEGRTGGLISITAELREGMAVIDFADNGCGMTEEVRKHAFDPFYTTHLGQGGSGLGLYLVHNLATGALGGHVELHDRKEGGITLHMTLPQRIGPLRAKN
jgi:signal transduction histidine kinase